MKEINDWAIIILGLAFYALLLFIQKITLKKYQYESWTVKKLEIKKETKKKEFEQIIKHHQTDAPKQQQKAFFYQLKIKITEVFLIEQILILIKKTNPYFNNPNNLSKGHSRSIRNKRRLKKLLTLLDNTEQLSYDFGSKKTDEINMKEALFLIQIEALSIIQKKKIKSIVYEP